MLAVPVLWRRLELTQASLISQSVRYYIGCYVAARNNLVVACSRARENFQP